MNATPFVEKPATSWHLDQAQRYLAECDEEMGPLPNPVVTAKIINDICVVSRHGVNLMDMKAVAEKAKQIGLSSLAELIERDLRDNKIMDGRYTPALESLYGGAQ